MKYNTAWWGIVLVAQYKQEANLLRTLSIMLESAGGETYEGGRPVLHDPATEDDRDETYKKGEVALEMGR